jgi:hypothetical protein
MAQHDYVIANGTGAAVRSDLNNGLSAIVSQNSGATAPATTYAYMTWADTTAGVMKMRNGANNAWITLYQLDGEWSTIAFENGSAAAPSIYFKDSGTDTGIYSPGTDQVAISTGGTGRLFIDASGRLLAGTSTARTNFFGTTLSSLTQIEGTGGSNARGSISVLNNDVSNNPPYVLLGRSGAATLGSNAAVVSGSRLGTVSFHGADGTSFIEAATVAGEVDGTPGSNDMPGRLVFSTTADGAASPTERLRIDSSGRVGVGTSSPTSPGGIAKFLQISDASSASIVLSRTAATASQLEISTYGSANLIQSFNAPLLFDMGSGEKMRLDTSGRLGIGTSTVDQLLHLKAANPVLEVEGTAASSGDTGIHLKANANEWFVRADNSTGTNTFSIKSGSPTSSTHRFLINSSGQCGIGTSSPGTRLTLSQSISTTFGNAGTYLGVGDIENGSGSYRLIGFGYKASSGNEYPAVIGYTETDNGGNTKGALVFGTRDVTTNTAPTERMRVDSNGHARFSQQNFSTDVSSTNYGFVVQAGSQPFINHGVTGTSLTTMYVFINGNGVVGTIKTTGSSTQYNTSSDYRLKENVEPITGAADRILQLKPCRFNFIADATKTVDGFIAHEVQEVVPEAISGDKDAVDDKGDPDYQGIDQSKLVPLLTAALQEAVAEIKTLKDRVTALEVA